MKKLNTLFILSALLISGNLSAQTCNKILGVWKTVTNAYQEFRSDGGVYTLPSNEISARWECDNSANGKFTINWTDEPLAYVIASDGKTFRSNDGKYTWSKITDDVGKIWWVNSNGTIQANAIKVGNLPICQCEYEGYFYTGNYANGTCNFVADNQGLSNNNFEILVRSKGIKVDWVQSDGWNTPPGLVPGGRSASKAFNVGAVVRNGQLYPGSASFPGGIKIEANVNGEVVVTKDFKWLSANIVPVSEDVSSGIDLMDIKSKEKKDGVKTGGN